MAGQIQQQRTRHRRSEVAPETEHTEQAEACFKRAKEICDASDVILTEIDQALEETS